MKREKHKDKNFKDLAAGVQSDKAGYLEERHVILDFARGC
jgi:hypothetical protein